MISDNPPVVSPSPSEADQKKVDKPILSRAPSIEEVENIELDKDEKGMEDAVINGETEMGDTSGNVDVDSLKDLAEEAYAARIKSPIENPDLRRESIAEIKKIAEGNLFFRQFGFFLIRYCGCFFLNLNFLNKL